MAKLKKAFFCQNCGAQHLQWQGKCNSCGEWNTLIEELLIKNPEKGIKKILNPLKKIFNTKVVLEEELVS